MESKFRFSIFTATYNRGHLLNSLYDCIKQQDYDHSLYEWVVVSDGSTDDTPILIQSFIKEGLVNIKFINKKNGGKHTAWREATKVFEGRYIVTADDDDPIPTNMLSIYDKYWKDLEKDSQYDLFWEVKSRCQYEDGTLVGLPLPKPYFDSDYIEIHYKLKKGAEMDGCRKVEVLRNEARVPDKFLFEEECSNYPEGLRWIKAARKYKTRFVPDITRTYVVGHDSLCVTPKGMKRSSKKNYNSLISALYGLNETRDILIKYCPMNYLFTVLQLSYSAQRANVRVLKYVNNNFDKFLLILFYIPSFMIKLIRS